MKHVIKDIYGKTLYEDDCDNISQCVNNAIVKKVCLENGDFSSQQFIGVNFDNSRFDNSSFYNSSFDNSRFYNSSFDNSRFYNSRFDNSSFYNSSFYNSRFDNSSFYNSSFYNSRFYNSRFDNSSFDNSSFDNSSFDNSSFDNTKIPDIAIAQTRILPEGDLIGWKKCQNGVIVKLKISAEAKRSSAFGRKCRCEYAEVLEVIGAEAGFSQYCDKPKVRYAKGLTVHCDQWDEKWLKECSGGIHFFITRLEAESY